MIVSFPLMGWEMARARLDHKIRWNDKSLVKMAKKLYSNNDKNYNMNSWNIFCLTFAYKLLKWRKCAEDANTIFVYVLTCRMIVDEEGNWPHLHSKFQKLCTWLPHRRGIWSKYMDSLHEIILGEGVFLRAIGLEDNLKIFQKVFQLKIALTLCGDLKEHLCNIWLKANFGKFF